MCKNNHKEIRVLVSAPLGVGGVTNMMINIQRHLDRKTINFDYLVFHDRKEPCEDIVRKMGSNKLVASVDDFKLRPLRRILRVNEIRKICKAHNVKFLHYNADSPADLMNIIGARLGGVKYVTIHSHNAGFGTAGKGIKITSFILKPFIPLFCNNFIGCSELAARFIFPKSIIKGEKYSILPNGIELQKYSFDLTVRSAMRGKLRLDNKFVVGHAGRFNTQKNHSFLLDVFKEVYRKDHSSVLLLFGVGELTEKMKEKANRLGIADAVIFYGASNEMEKMWQAMDVFVMPSLHEGLPVTGIEAQASGLPCIFADTITKEVALTEKTEFLSLNDSCEKWADRILAYKGSKRDSDISVLKEAGYDIQDTAKTIQDLYVNVAESL